MGARRDRRRILIDPTSGDSVDRNGNHEPDNGTEPNGEPCTITPCWERILCARDRHDGCTNKDRDHERHLHDPRIVDPRWVVPFDGFGHTALFAGPVF